MSRTKNGMQRQGYLCSVCMPCLAWTLSSLYNHIVHPFTLEVRAINNVRIISLECMEDVLYGR